MERWEPIPDFSNYETSDQGRINHCLTGKRKSHKGYHFEYA